MMIRVLLLTTLLAVVSAADLPAVAVYPAGVPFNNPIGVRFHEATTSLLVTSFWSTGLPHIFERLVPTGPTSFNAVPFGQEADGTDLRGASDEVYLATVTSDVPIIQPGWKFGDVFFCRRTGVISKLSFDGTGLVEPWVTLPSGFLRGSLVFDRVGTFGGDLIVSDEVGRVFRVNHLGAFVQIATVDGPAEGSIVIPNEPARWGPFAGHYVVGSETTHKLFTISPTGGVITHQYGGEFQMESLSLMKPGFSYYGVAFSNSAVAVIPAAEWNKDPRFQNGIVLGVENGKLYLMEYNAGTGALDLNLIPYDYTHWGGNAITQWEGADAAGIPEANGQDGGCVDPGAPVVGSQCDSAVESVTGNVASLSFGDFQGPCSFHNGVPDQV